jgi:hypothetical protein
MKKIFNLVTKIFIYLFLCLYAVFAAYPLVWMTFNSLKNNEEIFSTNPFGFPQVLRLENYVKAWLEYDVVRYFTNSIIVAAFVIIFTILFAMMFAYAISRLDFRGNVFIKNYVSLGMFIPVQIVLIPLVILVRDLHAGNSLISLILPYVAFELPFIITIFYGYLRSIPFEMEESAAIDGANIFITFFQIIVPLMKPVIITCALFVMLFSWNEFIIALVVIGKQSLNTLPIGLVKFQGQFSTDWGAMAASLVISSIPTFILYLLFSKEIESAVAYGAGIKG